LLERRKRREARASVKGTRGAQAAAPAGEN
jgi:hypothetical protein